MPFAISMWRFNSCCFLSKLAVWAVVLSVCFIQNSYAHFSFTPSCREAYTEVMAARFQKAAAIIQQAKKEDPSNDFPYLIENYIDFLTVIVTEEKAEFDKRVANKDFRLSRIQKGTSNSPYYLYSQAEIMLSWALVRIKFGEYVTAAAEVNKAYRLLVENNKRYPNFLPNKNALGQFHCIIGIIPSQFKWAVKLIGMEGSIKEGVQELREVLEVTRKNPDFEYMWPETAFFLTFFELNLHRDEKVIADLYKELKFKYDKTPLLAYCMASIALKTGRSKDADLLLAERNQGPEYLPFHLLDFLHGLAKANHLDPSSIPHFEKYLTHFKGKNYLKAACQKIAWIEYVNGNVEGYRTWMNKLKTTGNADAEEDKVAQKESELGLLPNRYLLKARLLCDGGYYKEAIAAIINDYDSDNFVTIRDQIEFSYRLGRIYQLWEKPDNAINYYKLCIERGRKSKYYFACNAALQLGIIYEKKGDKINARKYFEECLRIQTDEYKFSLDAKAKAGLLRLKDEN